MRILGLVAGLGIVLYLTIATIMRQTAPPEPNLLTKPSEIKNEVNQALDQAEKARSKALDEVQKLPKPKF